MVLSVDEGLDLVVLYLDVEVLEILLGLRGGGFLAIHHTKVWIEGAKESGLVIVHGVSRRFKGLVVVMGLRPSTGFWIDCRGLGLAILGPPSIGLILL